MDDNVIRDKSMKFAIRIVRLNQFLRDEKKEYVLSRQLLRSGTSIGANVSEAIHAFSRSDFLYKMYVAFKECSETLYWIELLYRTDYLNQSQFQSIYGDCSELRSILSSITKTTKDSE